MVGLAEQGGLGVGWGPRGETNRERGSSMTHLLVNRGVLGSLRVAGLTLLLWGLGLPAHAHAQAPAVTDGKAGVVREEKGPQREDQADLASKNVLILHAFEANMPINVKTDQGLLAALETGGLGVKQQFFEYLDLARNPGHEHRKQVAELLRLRYGQRKINLIITLYAEPLQFVLNDGRNLFPDAPILALYLPPAFEAPQTARRIIRHSVGLDMTGTIEGALKLVPETKRVYVVAGVYPGDKQYEHQARRDFKKWEGQLEFSYLSDMPLEDVLTTVSKAPPGTIIIFASFLADSAGRTYTSRDVVRQVSRVSPVPVFGLYDVLLGYGIAGGSIASYERNGTRAGQLALDILSGTLTPADVRAVLSVPPVPMFDWR
jgi:hypothetical protein